MDNKLKINITRKPPGSGCVVSYKETRIRKKLLEKLFGNSEEVTIIIPGKNTSSIEIIKNDDSSQTGQTASGNKNA